MSWYSTDLNLLFDLYLTVAPFMLSSRNLGTWTSVILIWYLEKYVSRLVWWTKYHRSVSIEKYFISIKMEWCADKDEANC